jgi:hypothetical protein
MDRVLGWLRQMVEIVPHDYHVVVLSDHGQSQGATFSQRYSESISDLVNRLIEPAELEAQIHPTENWGPVHTFLTEVRSHRHRSATTTTRSTAVKRTKKPDRAEHDQHGPDQRELNGAGPDRSGDDRAGPDDAQERERPAVVVTSAGNMAMIYLAKLPGRLTLREIEETYPRLISGLASHPGIGALVVESTVNEPVAIGPAGIHVLRTGRVDGTDPLAPYGEHAAADLLRHSSMPHVGDIVVISRLDDRTGEVAAFEELVGVHGGLGGWQTDAILIRPTELGLDGPITGPDALYDQFVKWLEDLGQRNPSTLDPDSEAVVRSKEK